MLKSIVSFFCSFLLGIPMVFGSSMPGPVQGNQPPQRPDHLDATSHYARMKLQRAESILSTLVFDPHNYHLILSSNATFGGEAVPPYVFSNKPSIIVYQGALSSNRSNEEIAFMLAHELGHLNLHHMEKMQQQMEKVFSGSPTGISGAVTFAVFKQKFQEREADLFGFDLYKQAGYSMSFFPHTLKIVSIDPSLHLGTSKGLGKEPTSLSMKDPHFSMKERFELLAAKSVALHSSVFNVQ